MPGSKRAFIYDKVHPGQGFNLNNAVLKTDMAPNTIIAKRIIKDHILSNLPSSPYDIYNHLP